jgi:hypothetical protein
MDDVDRAMNHLLGLRERAGHEPRVVATTYPIQRGVPAQQQAVTRRVYCPNCQQGGPWRGKAKNCPRCDGKPYGLYLWCRHGIVQYWRAAAVATIDGLISSFNHGNPCRQVDHTGDRHHRR